MTREEAMGIAVEVLRIRAQQWRDASNLDDLTNNVDINELWEADQAECDSMVSLLEQAHETLAKELEPPSTSWARLPEEV